MRPGRAVASFDSASAMLRALARFLRGRDVPLLGQLPSTLEPGVATLLGAVNRLPRAARERLYATAGWTEAIPARQAGEVSSAALAGWVADRYPRRRYPAVFLGSSNGALVHLAAALGAPWLPQTLLIPVRRHGVHPDEPAEDLRVSTPAAQAVLAANPDLALHHMHDPNQDRLMIAGMSYFRVKWLRLPDAYRRFLSACLPRGGRLVIVDCGLRWPIRRVGPRHVFQSGALGGATATEFHHGGPRVAEFLARHGSPQRAWESPPPDGESPEAEWGFEPAILPDLVELAEESGWRLRVLRFAHPEELSPVVADLYRRWYARRGLPAGRLLIESFLLVEPWWTLRTGSVPLWTVFNTEPSRAAVSSYLDATGPYDEIRMLLFSHGVDSIGLASIEDWEEVVRRARKLGTLTGADRDAYPRDFAVLARAHRELARVRALHPMPLPLDVAVAEEFLEKRHDIAYTML